MISFTFPYTSLFFPLQNSTPLVFSIPCIFVFIFQALYIALAPSQSTAPCFHDHPKPDAAPGPTVRGVHAGASDSFRGISPSVIQLKVNLKVR